MAMDAEPLGESPADFWGERDQDRERGSDKTMEIDPIAELRQSFRGAADALSAGAASCIGVLI